MEFDRDHVQLTGVENAAVYEDGMLAHVQPEHRYAERVVDVTPDSHTALFSQRMWKDGQAIFNGVLPAIVSLGEVEPGSFWLVESLVIETALLTDVGSAKVKLGSQLALTRSFVPIGAGGVEKNYEPPLYLQRGQMIVVCTQTTPAVSTVAITAQVRVVFID